MTPHRDADEAALEPFFAAARADGRRTRASAFLSSILADAAEVQAARAAAPAPLAVSAAGRRSARPSCAGADRRLARPRGARRLCGARLLARDRRRRLARRRRRLERPRFRREHGRPGRRVLRSRGGGGLSMATPVPGRRRRWMTWALVASLGLNLLGLGLIGGAWLKGPPPGPMPGVALWRYARAMPDPYRHDLGRALRDSRGRLDRPARGAAQPVQGAGRRADRRTLRPRRGRRRPEAADPGRPRSLDARHRPSVGADRPDVAG